MNFYKSARPVKTASSEQVRQPIYKSALDYWKILKMILKYFQNISMNNKFDYPDLQRVDTEIGRHYKDSKGNLVPSVTTVLSRTSNNKERYR